MIDLSPNSLMEHASTLKDKVVLITGGAAGFGKETALLAGAQGAKVVIADLKIELSRETCAEIREAGGICTAPDAPIDVTSKDATRIAFEHCLKEYRRVPDIIYANAGVSMEDRFEDDREIAATSSKDAYPGPPRYLTSNVNLNGAILTCAIAQEYWRSYPAEKGEERKRRLVLLSSLAGMTSIPGATTYSLSKHALLGYWHEVCMSLQKQERPGFEFYVICPFFAKTRIFAAATLIVLAGIPLVPVPVIAETMIHVASKPSSPKTQPGGVVILPDHGDPAIASPSDYDPLSQEWTAEMHARCSKTDKVPAIKRIWRDIAGNYFGTTSLNLFVRTALLLLCVSGVGVLIHRGLSRLPSGVALLIGTAVGLSGWLKRVKKRVKA